MNRCVALLVALLAALPVHAQNHRKFPADALRGVLEVVAPPEVRLNGTTARLSPGARIRGEDNLLRVSNTLVGGHWIVNYTLDRSGAVTEVWVLTAAERAVQPWPTSAEQAGRWTFDGAGQRWIKP